MGLLCCHDQVLWLVNMTSAGERQHYAFALIETLLQHLLTCYKIGLLYDVACILHRSCIKWGFLKEYLHRIVFAISVFHAYRHGWVCQCVYHPRKSIGFSLTDGEGCERLWHSLSRLILYLRVCGVSILLFSLSKDLTKMLNIFTTV
jgi:Kyakuja-Dileera-Zisupton transposase